MAAGFRGPPCCPVCWGLGREFEPPAGALPCALSGVCAEQQLAHCCEHRQAAGPVRQALIPDSTLVPGCSYFKARMSSPSVVSVMPVRSIEDWIATLKPLGYWDAADVILDDLGDYPKKGGELRKLLNANREDDKKQLGNALIAWAMLTAIATCLCLL
jgi:hypothetical protein